MLVNNIFMKPIKKIQLVCKRLSECLFQYFYGFQTWPNLKESFLEYFVTFPMDARLYQRPVTSVGTKHIKVKATPKKPHRRPQF